MTTKSSIFTRLPRRKMALLLEQDSFLPHHAYHVKHASALIEGRGSRCAQVFFVTGLVLDCEFQIVKLSSTLCGTARGINLQKANSEASMKWKMSSPLLLFFVSQIRVAQKMGVRAWKRRRRRRRRTTHTIGRSKQGEGTPITSCVCAYVCIVRNYQVGNG